MKKMNKIKKVDEDDEEDELEDFNSDLENNLKFIFFIYID